LTFIELYERVKDGGVRGAVEGYIDGHIVGCLEGSDRANAVSTLVE